MIYYQMYYSASYLSIPQSGMHQDVYSLQQQLY